MEYIFSHGLPTRKASGRFSHILVHLGPFGFECGRAWWEYITVLSRVPFLIGYALTAVKRMRMRNALVPGRRPRKFPAPKFNWHHCRIDRAEKRLRMRHLLPSRRVSAGKSRLKQQISNVKSITERWRYFVDFLQDFESFYFPKLSIYLRGIAFSGPYRWNFRKARDFVYFIDPLLCIVASRAAFSRHGLLTSR